MFRHARLVACSFLLACLTPCARADNAAGATPITDPALLVRLGLPPDARHVYLAKGAVLDQTSAAATPAEFGTSDFGWTTILGNQHAPAIDSTYSSSDGLGDVYRVSGGTAYDAQLHLPSGAILHQVRWWGIDNSAGFLSGTIIEVCQSIFTGGLNSTILGSGQSSTSSGNFSFNVVVNGGAVVDNLSCAYFARAMFDFSEEDLTLRKITAGWQRQVSAAPATATFPNDTPTTHPYFRFIEALAAAGITGGCAPQSYCPNNPITRGEMAVFLAVALGLHWPN